MNKAQDNNMPPGCYGCLLALIIPIALFFVLISLPTKPIEEDEYAQELLARTLCQQNVQQTMLNPKSTEFERKNDTATKIGNMEYNVTSTGYTTNVYGAQVQFNYSCNVKIIDENNGIVSNVVVK